MPISPADLAADAVAAQRAGAVAVHVHPRDAHGAPTMRARPSDAVVAAIRRAAPGLPVGLSTSAEIDPDPFARSAAVQDWRQRPDFVSVNLSELGWGGVARAALHAGIAVEAGLGTAAEAEELVRGPFVHQVLRVLVEVEGGAAEAHAVAELIPAGVAQLWHGFDKLTWEVIKAAASANVDVRVGLEDVLVLPDGRVAAGNAELIAAAVELVGRPS